MSAISIRSSRAHVPRTEYSVHSRNKDKKPAMDGVYTEAEILDFVARVKHVQAKSCAADAPEDAIELRTRQSRDD